MQSEATNQHNFSLEYFSLTGVVFSFGYFFSYILSQKASWVDLLVKATNLKHGFWGCTIVYTQKRISTPLFLIDVSLARYKTIFIDFKQNSNEQVVSQINKALSDIPVLSWLKETLEVNSVAYTNG